MRLCGTLFPPGFCAGSPRPQYAQNTMQKKRDGNMKNVRILISAMAGKVGNYIFALESLGAQVHCSLDPLVSAADADALLLPGGGDIDPAYYGEAINGSQQIDRELDQLQFSALDAFVRNGKPVLGICRGHQVINVYFGGTLIQHLPTADSHTAFSCQGVSTTGSIP